MRFDKFLVSIKIELLTQVFNEFYELLDNVAYQNGGDTIWASTGETAHEALIGLAEKHHPELGKRMLARLERDCDITEASHDAA